MKVSTMCRQLCTGGWEDRSTTFKDTGIVDTLNLLQWCGSQEGWGSLRICPDCEIVFLSRGNTRCFVCDGKIPPPRQQFTRKAVYITIGGYKTHD
jgi:hypothetical protein